MKKLFTILCLCLAFTSCSKDEELTLNTTSAVLYAQEEHQILTTNGTNVSFESENPYIATVNSTTGKVTAMTIGKTIIRVNSDQGSANVSVEVRPKYSTYTEPCTDFGITKTQIISMYGTPDTETDDGIMYVHNKTKHFADMYLFDNTLSSSTAIIPQDYAVEAAKFLLERYWIVGEEDDINIFANGYSSETITMSVALSKMSGYSLYMVMYIPYSNSDTRSITSTINNFEIDETLLEKFAEYKE